MAEKAHDLEKDVTTKNELSKDEKVDKQSQPVDPELDDLLDSALEDFTKPENTSSKSGQKPQECSSKPEDGSNDPLSDLFVEEFSDEMAKQFQDSMKSFMEQDPAMIQQIEKLAEAAGTSGQSEEAQKEFAKTLSSTLSSMAENSESLQDDNMSEEDLMKAFTGMGMEDGQDPFMPMMQGMMKTLLSKDVLYPSLKELSQKYPKWIKENKSKEEKSQMTRYEQQHKLVQEICEEFENEHDSDSENVKKLRFEKIIDLMQKMQDLGQPPKELVGDMAPGLEFDENGVPKIPGSPEGCVVM